MQSKRIIAKIVALFGIAFFILNACSSFKAESSDVVIKKFKQAVKGIHAADLALAATINSKDNKDNVGFNLNADVKFDRADENRKADIGVKMNGALNTEGKTLDGSLELNLIALGKDFYINLAKFESSDSSTESFKKAVQPYLKKWEHLASDYVPDNIKKLQEKDEDSIKKEDQLKDLFVNTEIFTVSKEFGVENLNGEKVYHFGIKFDKNGVKEFIKKASSINGVEKTDQEVADSAAFFDSVKNAELWIGGNDYYLYKGVMTVSGTTPATEVVNPDGTKAENKGDVLTDITLNFEGKSYNKDTKIAAPAEFEEFNPIAFLMSMQIGSLTPEADTTAESSDKSEEVSPDATKSEEVVSSDKAAEQAAETPVAE
jgi:hypothetical protein